MKLRVISVLLVLNLVFSQVCFASVVEVLKPTGETMGTSAAIQWTEEISAAGRVNRFLENNYFFMDGQVKMWNRTEVKTMPKAAYFEDSIMYISSEFSNELFGVRQEGEYTSVTYVDERLSAYVAFTDPRGFVLLTKSVTKSVKTNYSTNVQGYFDYYTVLMAAGAVLWEDITPIDEDYDAYIRNWQRVITMPDCDAEEYAEYLADVQTETEKYRSQLSLIHGDNGPFTDTVISSTNAEASGNSTNFQNAFKRVATMAKYYFMTGRTDADLKAEILACLEYLYARYSMQVIIPHEGDGWTSYAIDIPYQYGNILCLMYEDMTDEDRLRHAYAIFDRAPDPTTAMGRSAGDRSLANLSWCTAGFLNAAVLAKDAGRVNYALRFLNGCFIYNAEGYEGDLTLPLDGMYKDGSSVFHRGIPYTNGYCVASACNIAQMLLVTKDTIFDVRNVPYYENIYTMIKENFLPFIVDGTNMKAVSGRWFATSSVSNLIHMAIIAQGADGEIRDDLCSRILYWIKYCEEQNESFFVSDGKAVSGYTLMREKERFSEYCKNNSIVAIAPRENGNKLYYNMDKNIYTTDDYTAVISMSSTRAGKYESLGEKNYGGTDWYVNDGATYVYYGDTLQFGTEWMHNADKYYIPGTTVDETPRNIESNFGKALPENTWAGGATDGVNAAMGMIMSNESGLEGKKSYFIIDGKIICIGTDISGGEGNVHTTVDQRQVK